MDFLQGVKMSNVIPAHATIAESALYVIENGEMEFGNMMRNIGLNELAIVESTGTIITNEASVKDIVGKIVAWLQDKWSKVKELFNKALSVIEGKIDEFKKRMNAKNLEALKKRAASLKEIDDKGVKKIYGKSYQFKNVETVLNGDDPIQKAIKAFEKEIHSIIGSYKGAEDGETAARISQDAREKLSDAQDNLYKAVASATGVDEDDITNETKLITVIGNFIRGEEIEIDKKYIVDNLPTIHASVTESGKSLKSTKKLYNEFKKSYNEDIAFIKKDRKNVGSEIYTVYAKALKTGKNMGTAVVGAILANVKAQVSINMKIVMKLAMTIPVKEAAVVESSSYQTELVSLFNF